MSYVSAVITDLGYLEMVKLLKAYGIKISIDPDILLYLPMLTLTEPLQEKDPELNPYSR